jgi:tetratricopeptide (TPR) repeat protein
MSNNRGLDPRELKLPTLYRSFVYKISHFIGPSRPNRFFRSYGGRLLILLFICVIIVLTGAYFLSPHPETGVAENTTLAAAAGLLEEGNTSGSTNTTEVVTTGLFAGENTSENSTLVPGGSTISATRPSWSSILGNITVFVSEGVQSASSLVTEGTIAAIIMLFILGFVASAGVRSRRQVLVGEFKNYIGSDTDAIGKFTGGVSPLLNVELHRLRRLYSDVDDRRAISSLGGRTGPLDYAITAGDTGELFKNIYSSETKVKIGIIEIPVGAVSGLFSRIFAGPQIVGGFHQDGDTIILSAFMSGPESRSWRIERKINTKTTPRVDNSGKDFSPSAEDRPIILSDKGVENLDGMVKELAYRIFTDLTEGGTMKWQATAAFTEGLRDYRSCLLSKKDQLRNLKNAERRFFEAISEDSTFGLAWHNLGVVYTELKNLEASDKAFLKAIEIWPEGWEAYYAIALNRFNRMIKTGNKVASDECLAVDELLLQDVIQPCQQAIVLNPDNPHLHILLGVCYRLLAIQKRNSGSDEAKKESNELFRKAVEEHTTAAKKAWHALCAYQFNSENSAITRDSDIRKASSTALWDLARTYYTYSVCGRSIGLEGKKKAGFSLAPIESVLRQAISIDKTNDALWYHLGSVYYAQAKFPEAIRAFESASQIDPTELKYWLLVALSSQEAGDINKREFAVGKILGLPSWMNDLSESLKNKIKDLPMEGKCRDLRMILDFQEDTIGDTKTVTAKLDELSLKPEEGRIYWSNLAPLINGPLFGDTGEGTSASLNAAIVSYLAYHSAHHTEDTPKKLEFYQKALNYLPDPSETGWSRWARGLISYELASLSEDPYREYKVCYHCFKDDHPLELMAKQIQNKLIPLYQEKNKKYEALRCAAGAVHRNPIGFNELYSYGESLFNACDFTRSLSAFKSALLLKPYSVETLIFLGACCRLLRDNSQEREEKEEFTKKAIRYYEEAREAQRAKAFNKTQRNGAQKPGGNKNYWGTVQKTNEILLAISMYLGDLYFDLSEYGKSMSNYERGIELSSYIPSNSPDGSFYFGDEYYCALKYAEAALHKRDHQECEKYLFRVIQNLDESSSERNQIQETVPQISQDFYIPFYGLRESAYLGEVYAKTLLIQAYSYSERDIALDRALELVNKADEVIRMMKERISQGKQLDRDLNQLFFQNIPLLEAETLDRRGWVYFKKGKLEDAKKEIKKALALKADAEYYFHLAHVYEALSRETDKKAICARWALAYCDHALDIALRPGLVNEVTKLKDRISQ